MTLYSTTLALFHAGFGTVALLTFWTAGLARKGSVLHARAGQLYLLAMAALLVLALPMSVMIVLRGGPGVAIGSFLLYLVLISSTSVWLSWRAIRDKRDRARYTGAAYRALMWANLGGAVCVALFGLLLADRMQLIMVSFSLIGIVSFMRMRAFLAQASTDPRWWLREHLQRMLGNGVATHIAFLSIGLPRLLPQLSGPALINIAWLMPLLVAVLAELWLRRKYLPTLPAGRAVAAP